jgi:putative endonuclease
MAEAAGIAQARGARGEALAAAWLEGRGYAVLARNFRCREGEIDIVAEKDGAVAFVEVKSWRAHGRAELEHSIGPAKQRRIARAARRFLLSRAGLRDRSMSFDVILLAGGRIEHLQNAFGGSVE